jgi:hypothetical protein
MDDYRVYQDLTAKFVTFRIVSGLPTIRKLIPHRGPKASSSCFGRSPTTHPQHAFRITITLHCDFRGHSVDFAQLV